MAMFFNPMPMSGAVLVENPAKNFVDRVARAVQYDKDLYAAYKSGNFFSDSSNLQRAVATALSFRQGTGKQMRAAKKEALKATGGQRGAEFDKLYAAALAERGISPPQSQSFKLVKQADGSVKKVARSLAPAFRRALAGYMGKLKGYENAITRNRARYLDVYSKATGLGVRRVGNRMVLGDRYKQFKVKGGLKGKSWKGALKESKGNAELLRLAGIRGPGVGSLNAAKAAKLEELRALGTQEHPWWEDTGRLDAFRAYKGTARAERKAAAAARPKAPSVRDADAMAAYIAGRFDAAAGADAYRPLNLAARRGTGKPQAVAAAKSLYRNDKGLSKMLTDAQAKSTIYKKWTKVADNPFSGLSDNEFGFAGLALSNPIYSTNIGVIDSIEDVAARIPVVGEGISPMVAPLIAAGAAGAVHIYLVPKLQQHLPEQAQPFAYTIGGTLVGALAAFAGSRMGGTYGTAVQGIGAAAAAVGVGIDIYRRWGSGETATAGLALSGVSEEYSGLALSGADDMGAVALGDGGAYQIQNLGFDGDHTALSSMYADATAADAYFSGPDLDGAEGEAALAGASAYLGAFGASPLRAAGQRRAQSRHAGQRGHRWGWLIKMVGWQKFQQIVALPPEQRLQVIKSLREQAMASVQQFMDQARAAKLASTPVTAPPALSADLSGYGTTLFSGGSY